MKDIKTIKIDLAQKFDFEGYDNQYFSEFIIQHYEKKLAEAEGKLSKFIEDCCSDEVYDFTQYCQGLHFGYGKEIEELEKKLAIAVRELEESCACDGELCTACQALNQLAEG